MTQEEHEAIKRTKGNNEYLSWEDYKSMDFTRSVSYCLAAITMGFFSCENLTIYQELRSSFPSQVIKETLRFGNPPLNNLLFRKTLENVEVEGMERS